MHKEDGITKLIDGEVYYKFDYANFLYEKLQEKDDEIDKYKNVIDKIKEYCNYNNETLYTFEPDYDYEENMIENYEVSNFRENILELLEEVE